jgi:MoaA/NifB/PqqE/SkfB family radical SAM enzyme
MKFPRLNIVCGDKENPNLAQVNKMRFCYLTITERCFFRCKTCYAWKRENCYDEATFEEWKNFLNSLKEISDTQAEIHLSGGEPLLHDWALDLIKCGSAQGFNMTMATNAFLIDREMAKKIKDAGLRTIIISLNSLDEEIHDFLKGTKGSYRKTMDAIAYLTQQAGNPEICICTIISQQTLPGLIKLIEWVGQQDKINAISFQAITQPFHTPTKKRWYQREEYSLLWPSEAQEAFLIMEELIHLKEGQTKIGNSVAQLRRYQSYFMNPDSLFRNKCNVGNFSLTVHPNGDMSLCRFGSIGNIKKDNIQELWYSEKLSRVRKKMKSCRLNCEHLVNGSYEDN